MVATVRFASVDDVIVEYVPSRTPSRDLMSLMRSSSQSRFYHGYTLFSMRSHLFVALALTRWVIEQLNDDYYSLPLTSDGASFVAQPRTRSHTLAFFDH